MSDCQQTFGRIIDVVRCIRESYEILGPRTRRKMLRDVGRALARLDCPEFYLTTVQADIMPPAPPQKYGAACGGLLIRRPGRVEIAAGDLVVAIDGIRQQLEGWDDAQAVRVIGELELMLHEMRLCPTGGLGPGGDA